MKSFTEFSYIDFPTAARPKQKSIRQTLTWQCTNFKVSEDTGSWNSTEVFAGSEAYSYWPFF